MSAGASWATSGCQLLSLVGESVSHHVSTPAKSTTEMTSFRQNGLTSSSTTTNVMASSTAARWLPAPNGASNHTAPNVQAIAIMAKGIAKINLIAAINSLLLVCQCFVQRRI